MAASPVPVAILRDAGFARSGDVPGLDSGSKTSYRWLRQAGVLFFAFTVGTIVPPTHVRAEINTIDEHVHGPSREIGPPWWAINLETKFCGSTFGRQRVEIIHSTKEEKFFSSHDSFFCCPICDAIPEGKFSLGSKKAGMEFSRCSDLDRLWIEGWAIHWFEGPVHVFRRCGSAVFQNQSYAPVLQFTVAVAKGDEFNFAGKYEGALDIYQSSKSYIRLPFGFGVSAESDHRGSNGRPSSGEGQNAYGDIINRLVSPVTALSGAVQLLVGLSAWSYGMLRDNRLLAFIGIPLILVGTFCVIPWIAKCIIQD